MSRKILKKSLKMGNHAIRQGRKQWAELEGAKLQNVCNIHLLKIDYTHVLLALLMLLMLLVLLLQLEAQ